MRADDLVHTCDITDSDVCYDLRPMTYDLMYTCDIADSDCVLRLI